jgi:hypothetical protein
LIREIEPHSLLALGDQLVAVQAHHHSLFLDQTVNDALGGEGWGVRRQAAFEATHALLASLCGEYGIVGARERLDLACELFSAMGHGRLELEITAEGGIARAHGLHFGESFSEKYGGKLRNRKPLDAFAAGFVAAAASLAYPSDWGTLEADESLCVARGDDHCELFLTRRAEMPRFGAIVTRPVVETLPATPTDDRDGGIANATLDGAARLIGALEANDSGVVRAFGVRLAVMPVSYSSQITFDTMHLVEKRTPELFPVVCALTREATQIGAFHMLGGILASSAFREVAGAAARDIESRLHQLTGIGRALGWGGLYADDFLPGRSLVLRAAVTHESAYYAVRHGSTVRSRLAALQGVALAIMQLLHRVDFESSTPLEPGAYDTLFQHGPRFHVEETRSPLRGDRLCEVVVEAVA